MFYKRAVIVGEVIVEEVRAWEKCKKCNGDGFCSDHPSTCAVCDGFGGKQHEAVRENPYTRFLTLDGNCINKDSILIREHEVCKKCKGDGLEWIEWTDMDGGKHVNDKCCHCLKDADGNPTGAEPNTATPWQVKEE